MLLFLIKALVIIVEANDRYNNLESKTYKDESKMIGQISNNSYDDPPSYPVFS